MKKNFSIFMLSALVLLISIFVLSYKLLKNQAPQKTSSKIEIVEELNDNLAVEFDLENYEKVISPKYKLTCNSEKCSFDVLFDISKVPTADRTKTKIFLKITNSINVFNHFGEIDDSSDKIYFEIFNYQPSIPLELGMIVVYNPNMGSIISR